MRLATASGVHVAKAQESLTMALLALNARLPEIVWNQRHARWDMIFTPLVRGKTVAVVGLGDMGRAAVESSRGLGLKVIGVRRSGKKVAGVGRVYRPAQLAAALRRADFIVVAAPLTSETSNLLSARVLRVTKRGVGIINVGRAGVVDYDALVKLLRTGHVSGAVLDVFAEEPLPSSSALWSKPNVIGCTHYHENCADNLRRAVEGRGIPLPYVPTPLNLFMNTKFDRHSVMIVEPPEAKPGDSVTFRAEHACMIVLSACPQDLVPVNAHDCTPKAVAFRLG